MSEQLKNLINSFKSEYDYAMSLHDKRGNFLIFNQASKKIFDLTTTQLFKKSIFELMIPFSKFDI